MARSFPACVSAVVLRESGLIGLEAADPSDLAIPTVVLHELEYGTLKISSAARRKVLSEMLDRIEAIPFDKLAARESARVRLQLERAGAAIGPMDLLIAGTALSRGAVLVTNNTREFERIRNLRLEDWSEI